jgi:hypothetical protein
VIGLYFEGFLVSESFGRFINVLCKKLTENNFQCSKAESDADHLIVRSALDCLFPHVAVVAEGLSPDDIDKELYFLKPVIMSYSQFIQRKQI